MSYRRFTAEGRIWEAWEVHPSAAERRLNEERRRSARPAPDRRQRTEVRFVLPPQLRFGWLAFQLELEKRRLAPIPKGWKALTEVQMGDLLRRATPIRHPIDSRESA
jgi:hypothetical protein